MNFDVMCDWASNPRKSDFVSISDFSNASSCSNSRRLSCAWAVQRVQWHSFCSETRYGTESEQRVNFVWASRYTSPANLSCNQSRDCADFDHSLRAAEGTGFRLATKKALFDIFVVLLVSVQKELFILRAGKKIIPLLFGQGILLVPSLQTDVCLFVWHVLSSSSGCSICS